MYYILVICNRVPVEILTLSVSLLLIDGLNLFGDFNLFKGDDTALIDDLNFSTFFPGPEWG